MTVRYDSTRRNFMLASAGLVALLGCQSENKGPFSFLQRTSDPAIQKLFSSTDPNITLKDTIPYMTKKTKKDQGFREIDETDMSEGVKIAAAPYMAGVNVVSRKKRTLGRIEPNPAIAEAYATYAKDIIEWTKEHPAMQKFHKPDLEFLVLGRDERTTTDIPCYVHLADVEQYKIHVQKDLGKGLVLNDEPEFSGFVARGIVTGLITTGPDAKGHTKLLEDEVCVRLSTGREKPVESLISPLSEYLALVFHDGLKKHFAAFEQLYGGNIPQDKLGHALAQMIGCFEGVTEALSAHLLLEYVQQEHVKPHLPPTIKEDIERYIQVEICEEGENADDIKGLKRYAGVPATFNWGLAEGIEAVGRTYTSNSHLFVQKMNHYEIKRKGKK